MQLKRMNVNCVGVHTVSPQNRPLLIDVGFPKCFLDLVSIWSVLLNSKNLQIIALLSLKCFYGKWSMISLLEQRVYFVLKQRNSILREDGGGGSHLAIFRDSFWFCAQGTHVMMGMGMEPEPAPCKATALIPVLSLWAPEKKSLIELDGLVDICSLNTAAEATVL